ncbi:ATP-dependent nuclease [Aeromonas veronii]|uniref:ATP-dependent nuclease n=1 Tax=Aeromonas veronii TaxID=654 RepID=UPI003B9F8FC4
MYRKAKIDDFHRRITDARDILGVNRIEFTAPFGDGDVRAIEINTPVIIFGANGSGKTRILNAIGKKLGNRVTFHNVTIYIEDDVEVKYYSPSDSVISVISQVENTVGKYDEDLLNDVLNEAAPYTFDEKRLDFVNYILSSRFDSISVYEISAVTEIDTEGRDEDDEGEVVPYFTVSEGGVSRRMTHLSHGEIYCIHFIWMFTVKYPSGILLVDEPETYLYPLAQNRFIDVLTCISCDGHARSRQSILATHSKNIIEKGRSYNVINMYKVNGEQYSFMTTENQDHNTRMQSMGLRVTKPFILLVEDAKARLFLRMIIEKCGSDRLKDLDKLYFAAANGHSFLTRFKSHLLDFNGFVVALVYDADAVDQINQINEGISKTLPGLRNPEEDLISSVTFDNGFGFVSSLTDGYDKVVMLQAVRECLNINHHDFFIELARCISADEIKVFELVLDYWLSVENNRNISEDFCTSLEDLYNRNAVL